MRKRVIRENENQPIIWNSFISPSNLWRIDGNQYNYILNGVTMGYKLDNKQTDITVVLRGVYLVGIILHVMTIILSILYLFKHRRSKI
jgi:hypothetical protein